MNQNRLLIAVVVLGLLTGAVVMTVRSRQSATSVEKPTATLPKLKKEDITAIDIIKPDKVTVSLSKQNGAWALTAPVAAKADTTAVDSLLAKLSELEVTGVAATRKENHKRLQVDADTAIRVKAKAGDKQLADLYVGVAKGGSTMVRAEGQEQVLSVLGSIRYAFDKDVKSFRDRVISDTDPAELTSMVLQSSKGTFKFDKTDAGWKQAAGEKPIQRFSETKVQALASTLARLRAADFAEPGVLPNGIGFAAPTATATLTKKDGGKLVLELGKDYADGREVYLRAVGNDVIYRVSKMTAERMSPDATAFQEAEKKEGEAPPPDPHGGMPGGMPGGAGGQLPPEIMEQLQRQLQAGGGGGAH